MRNLLILLLLCLNLTLTGTTYYIDPSGKDSNNGTSNSPWKTLAYACSNIKIAGDIIHVDAGTYIETLRCSLAVGVSIEGEGATSIIKSHYISTEGLNSGFIQLSGGTNSGQHISGIYLDGDNLTANNGILVYNRSNVSIHNCTIINFLTQGVRFSGSGNCTGNSFYNNSVSNSGGYDSDEHANLSFSYNTGILIYGNTIIQDKRPSAGTGLGIQVEDNTFGAKIYNNNIRGTEVSASGNGTYAIELWCGSKSMGHGMEIYGNTIVGEVDFGAGVMKGSYTYGVDFHNNIIGYDVAEISTNPSVGRTALQFEEIVSDVIVRSNLFKGINRPLYFCSNGTNGAFQNISIYNNIFQNINFSYLCQNTSAGYSAHGSAIIFGGSAFDYIRNVYIQNNDLIAYSTNPAEVGVFLPTSGDCDNVIVQNNIFQGFSEAAITAEAQSGGGSLTTLVIQKNIFFQNGNSNNLKTVGISPTAVNNDGGIKSNPSFVSSTDFHLQPGSPAINSGVYIAGLTVDYEGNTIKNPPSIGAYENASSVPVPVVPVYQSSVVQNATPSVLEMTYDIALSNIVPAVSSFTVVVNSVARTVNKVTISGTTVQLALASPVAYGEVVAISYNKPSSNPLQTSAGGQAASISVQSTTNKVNSVVSPVYVSSVVQNTTPLLLEMTYNLTLANIVPAASSFSVMVNSVVRTVNAVTISGVKIQLTLSVRILPGDIVTVSYTKPSTNPIQTAQGVAAVNITSQPVINNCINTVPTAVITSPVANSSFTASANITITADVSDTDGSVSLVEFYNGNTKLGSKSSAPYSMVWNNVTTGNYSLTAIATDNLNAKTTSPAILISVINSPQKVNQHPRVKISNPRKGITFDDQSAVTIEAEASDPDGTIDKVELFNGTIRLVELTEAPYTYTWKDVTAGTYSITAVATDNLRDTTVSAPVEFIVGTTVKYDANSEIIKLYPNPNNGHFSVEFINPLQNDKSEILITDLSGKKVYSGPVLKEEMKKQIDMSNSRNGIYIMMIKDKEILVTKKFIKN
jgi:uncharacterized repeat protein (TIGR02059 family)